MPSRDSQRQLSKEMVGREHALAVARVFLDATDMLDIDEVVGRSLASRTTVFKELELLVEIDALRRWQAKRNLYQRVDDHPYWPFAQALLERARARQRSSDAV